MFSRIIKLKIWQALIYEISIISLGIIIGSFWHQFFWELIPFFATIFIITGAYLLRLFWQQVK